MRSILALIGLIASFIEVLTVEMKRLKEKKLAEQFKNSEELAQSKKDTAKIDRAFRGDGDD